MPTNMRQWRSKIDAMAEGPEKEAEKASYRDYGGILPEPAPQEPQQGESGQDGGSAS